MMVIGGVTATAPSAAALNTPPFGMVTEVSGSPGGNAYFNGVSCTDAADCTAIGYDHYDQPVYAIESAGSWGRPTEDAGSQGMGGMFSGVSCVDASDCTAVGVDGNLHNGDSEPIVATESAGTWGSVTEIPGSGGGYGLFTSVDCTDPVCQADVRHLL
jgi:hypothetical protein